MANGLLSYNVLIDYATCSLIDMICNADMLLTENAILEETPPPLLLCDGKKLPKAIGKWIMVMAQWLTLLQCLHIQLDK